jgi:hypothetical protein
LPRFRREAPEARLANNIAQIAPARTADAVHLCYFVDNLHKRLSSIKIFCENRHFGYCNFSQDVV